MLRVRMRIAEAVGVVASFLTVPPWGAQAVMHQRVVPTDRPAHPMAVPATEPVVVAHTTAVLPTEVRELRASCT